MLISVILTTKDSAAHINRCLAAVKAQDYPNVEIVVVDNHSTDATVDIARRYTDKVFVEGPERSAQRNYAVERCTGEYFLQLDADQYLLPDVVSACVEKVRTFRAGSSQYQDIALQIPENIVGGSGWFFNVRNFEKQFYTNTVIDCVRFMPVGLFLEVGGYDVSMTGGEDWDLDKRIRQYCAVDVIESHMEHDEGAVTLSSFLKKKWYYSAAFDRYISKWGKDDADTKKRFGFTYRYFGVFTENGKWKILLKHPFLSVSLFFTKVLVGMVFLARKILPNNQS